MRPRSVEGRARTTACLGRGRRLGCGQRAPWMAACVVTPGGGGDAGPEGSSPDATSDGPSDAHADAPADSSADHSTSDGTAGDSGSDAADASHADAADAAPDAGPDVLSCAVPDIPPEGGARCGNGWRDPTEECDLGDAGAAGAGGPTCPAPGARRPARSIDVARGHPARRRTAGSRTPPAPWAEDAIPLAASDTTFAVATLENPGVAADGVADHLHAQGRGQGQRRCPSAPDRW